MTDPSDLLRSARERVERRVAELTATFVAIVESSASANLDDEHDPEGATVAFERTQVANLLDAARRQLVELDAARDRLARGRYGVCEECAQLILRARLEAQPAARLCVACAER